MARARKKNMEPRQQVREYQFDNIKALLIFLVVLGHVLKNFGTTEAATTLYKIIFSFHMPAFLFVSGYFAKCNPKRVLAQMFPLYVVFQCGRFLLDLILGSIAAGEFVGVKWQLFTPRWTLWYLFAMIVYQLLLPVFDTKRRAHQAAYLILTAALGLAIGFNRDAGNFMAMSRIISFLPFFLFGYYEKGNRLLLTYGKKRFPKSSRLLSACLGVALVIFFIVERERIPARLLYGNEGYDGGELTWYSRLLAWAVAFAWIWILLVWIPERRIPVIGTIGSHTLSVYLLHSIVIGILVETTLPDLIDGRLALILLLSALMTVGLSWNGFERVLRKIRIPYRAQK